MFLSRGFQAFLPKPIEIARLDSVIREFVRDKEQEKLLADKQFESGGELLIDVRGGKDRRSGYDRRSLPEISGLDIDQGLRRFGGDIESYLKVLRSFTVNTVPLLEIIKSADDLENYAVTIHGIKGSGRGICAEPLADMAEALEQAAKAGDAEFIRANNSVFLESAVKLIGSLETMLGKMDNENPKPKKARPDGEVLQKLLAACEKYQMDAVDAAMAELENYAYESGGELIGWLRENVDKMNFTEIKERLSAEG
jgi:HPt (histidine-containing phosphotransfer) domain-containing protein